MADKKAKEAAEAEAKRIKPGKIVVPSIKIDPPVDTSDSISKTARGPSNKGGGAFANDLAAMLARGPRAPRAAKPSPAVSRTQTEANFGMLERKNNMAA